MWAVSRFAPHVAVAVVAAVAASTAVAAVATPGVRTLSWRPGWDDTTQPLNYARSYVRFDTRTPRVLTITYHLEGAAPSSAHYVGLHIFVPSTSACLPRFGQYLPTACGTATRQGVTATLQALDFIVMPVNAAGTGTKVVSLKGVKPGTYRVEFGVRISTCKVCNYIYQSPGPFGKVVLVTVNP